MRKVCARSERSTGNKKRKAGWNEFNGYWWQDDETFDIERILDKKVELRKVGRGKKQSTKEFIFYKILWEDFPPECATWEPADSIHDGFIDEYEAALEAEADLEAEEERDLAEDEVEDGQD